MALNLNLRITIYKTVKWYFLVFLCTNLKNKTIYMFRKNNCTQAQTKYFLMDTKTSRWLLVMLFMIVQLSYLLRPSPTFVLSRSELSTHQLTVSLYYLLPRNLYKISLRLIVFGPAEFTERSRIMIYLVHLEVFSMLIFFMDYLYCCLPGDWCFSAAREKLAH